MLGMPVVVSGLDMLHDWRWRTQSRLFRCMRQQVIDRTPIQLERSFQH
jgi:hypothetical protein